MGIKMGKEVKAAGILDLGTRPRETLRDFWAIAVSSSWRKIAKWDYAHGDMGRNHDS
jgi:hypothetical protein